MNQQAVLVDAISLSSVGFPSREVAAVEEFDLPAGLAGSSLIFRLRNRAG